MPVVSEAVRLGDRPSRAYSQDISASSPSRRGAASGSAIWQSINATENDGGRPKVRLYSRQDA